MISIKVVLNKTFRRVLLLTPLCVLVLSNLTVYASQDGGTGNTTKVVGFNYETLSTALPKGLSDMTANIDTTTGLVYIVGGCDATNGNSYIDGRFQCTSVSSSLYSFNPTDGTFNTDLPDMPTPGPRYRHAAVLIEGNLWVHGGRGLDDTIISTVMVYNIEAGTWTTFNNTDNSTQFEQYHGVSDHVGFPNYETQQAYFCGGYTADYDTRAECISIDTAQSLESSTLVVQERASMIIGRGDIAVVSDSNGAIITGGFSGANEWCEPYTEAEQYSFDSDTWTMFPSMNIARGDKALVKLNEGIYAIGGEREVPNICKLTGDNKPGPAQQRVTVDDIEVYDSIAEKWIVLEDLPDYRFRFSAVAYDDTDRIYAFGGQLTYNETCQCLPTTSEITIYTVKFATMNASDASSTTGSTSAAGQHTISGVRQVQVFFHMVTALIIYLWY